MYTRHDLRVKVYKTTFAFFQNAYSSINIAEKELWASLTASQDLYLGYLELLCDLQHQATLLIDELKNRPFATKEELNPKLNFSNNAFIQRLDEDSDFRFKVKQSWSFGADVVKALFHEIQQSSCYQEYQNLLNPTFEQDQKFLVTLLEEEIFTSTVLEADIEDGDLAWQDELELIHWMVLETLRRSSKEQVVLSVFNKDERVNKVFVSQLFRKALQHQEEYFKYIQDYTSNYDFDRILLTDKVLMLLALTEVVHFEDIPIRTSLNEYINIAKTFSEAKSGLFINAILDKIIKVLQKEDKIHKTGRGLIEF